MENTKTIQSWINQRVRIKEEYIYSELVVDEYESTYDDDGNIIEEVLEERIGFMSMGGDINNMYMFIGKEREVFEVRFSFYGADLYGFQNEKVSVNTLPEPEHLIIMKDQNVPYTWKAKYFEVVKPKTIYVTDNEFNK